MKKGILLLGISLSLSFALECKSYRVREGDSLEKIARREGVSLDRLRSANRGLDEKRLRVGQEICIPTGTSGKRSAEKYAVYEVKKGDSLQKIADSFGVDVKTLKEFNNLRDGRLVEGQKIRIPAREGTTAKRERREGREYEVYTVRKGGSLKDVSKATGIPLRELERLNPQLKNAPLKPGTQVKLPKGARQAEKKEERYELYTIRRGARLEHVAKATETDLKELERLNPELKGRWLPAGTRVKIPFREREQARSQKTGEESYRVYRVRSGGRLSDVARATGVSLKELERLNPELRGKPLKAGTRVKLPAREPVVVEKPAQERQQPPDRRAERSVVGELERESPSPAPAPAQRSFQIQLPVDGRVSKVPKGIEISAPCSSPVKAVEEGRVIYSGGDLQAYGNMVIVEHEGFISLYAHNEANLVKRGERVSKGQVIARVGKKGNSEECLLRFELRNKEGIPLDPTEYIRDLQ